MRGFAKQFSGAWLLILAACGDTSVLGTGKSAATGGVGPGGGGPGTTSTGGGGGAGPCEGSSNGTSCDNGDACSKDDACSSGVCVGTPVTCDTPPAPTCIDATTLRTFAEAGTCSAGECSYAPSDKKCQGTCVGDACAQADTWTDMTTVGAPSRTVHSTVWTGSEMIVWGGSTATSDFNNTGGRYNPATDMWTALSTVGAPSARYNHPAVWTGVEMIVWGGKVSDGAAATAVTNTGGRYNPATDTWTALSTVGAPSARFIHREVWTGSEMIVWGGQESDGSTLTATNTGGRYNPATDTWTPLSTVGAPSAGYLSTAVWTGSEIIVWGGQGTDGISTATGGRYKPSTNTWTKMSTTGAPSARTWSSAAWTGSEMIVWGGLEKDGSTSTVTNTGDRYNPATDTWTPLPTSGAPSKRYEHSAVWTGSEMIVWAGFDPEDGSFPNTGARYNSTTDTWMALSPSSLSPRIWNSAVWTGSEMIVWGGHGTSVVNTGGRYLP